MYNEGHTYAKCQDPYEAYTVREYDNYEDAIKVTRFPIVEYSSDFYEWIETSFEDVKKTIANEMDDNLGQKFYTKGEIEKMEKFLPYLKNVYTLSYLGNGVWEHGHVLFVFEIPKIKFTTLRWDINGSEFPLKLDHYRTLSQIAKRYPEWYEEWCERTSILEEKSEEYWEERSECKLFSYQKSRKEKRKLLGGNVWTREDYDYESDP